MNSYIGNGAYCYANSAAMLLSSIGENISPSLIEVLSGFSLGASIFDDLIYFDDCTSSPDKAINVAFETLGFKVKENASLEKESIPLKELKLSLSNSVVMLGPLDMGYLTYLPNHKFLGGADHYVLAIEINDYEILLHDPAGYPFVSLSLNQLEKAWRADQIHYKRGHFRYWHAPKRTSNLTQEDIYVKAIQNFKKIYLNQQNVDHKSEFGKEAILFKSKQLRRQNISEKEIGHLIFFALPLAARRAHDFSLFFINKNDHIAKLKETQSKLFGQCHSFATSNLWNSVADKFVQLADIEEEIRKEILNL
ncbi:hypothetical protein [Chengkuizengella marina]|uniref:Butirosin biosynthesis protein H, N-terminal n=1 Tax=Chengkuizengella marina TaxID=2507566 RepID=A0A6N9Q4D9_9BACL|nr:hypothetical protein [Chengkuizengella marina]NBI29677.1 hypothetical protein [Chengkuizengella marina]